MLNKIIFGYEPDEEPFLLDFVKKNEIGGIILYSKNIHENTPDFLENLLQNSINKDLLFAVDQEGGNVRRFKDEDIFFMGAREAVRFQNPIQYGIDVEFMAQKLKKYNINLILAPVIDLTFSRNNIVFQRTYGDFQSIINFGFSFYKAVKKYGIHTCLKHFFGYGVIDNTDPHKIAFKINDDTEIEPLLEPFIWFIKHGYNDFIMSAHVEYQGEIITYSRKWLNDFLKKKLYFNGKIITDDLYMKAAGNFPLKEKIKKALSAGNDYCIVSGGFKNSLKEL